MRKYIYIFKICWVRLCYFSFKGEHMEYIIVYSHIFTLKLKKIHFLYSLYNAH